MMTENAGLFVVRAKELSLAGGVKKVSVPNLSTNPTTSIPPLLVQVRNTSQSFSRNVLQSPHHPGMGPGDIPVRKNGQFPGHRPQRIQRDNRDRTLLGVTVRVVKGPYKGYIGIVKDATETTARIELHSSCKTISVDKTRFLVIRYVYGNNHPHPWS